jgi:periplasmic divalent cation tolerance protein
MITASNARMVVVTCGSIKEARKIARLVVEKRLAACVNVISAPVESVYRWKGRLERAKEFVLLIKTTTGRLPELQNQVAQLHSYDLPEFLVLRVDGGSRKYMKWLAASVQNR